MQGIEPHDLETVAVQLQREPRDIVAIAHRCPCGLPDVVATKPRLSDGSPFPTVYYLTCPRAASRIGTLEAAGVMRDMEQRLGSDADLRHRYEQAHESYIAARTAIAKSNGIDEVPEMAGVSAGGMPTRVKCLHVMAAHALAAGPGVNPFGDEVLERLGEWWQSGPCVPVADEADAVPSR